MRKQMESKHLIGNMRKYMESKQHSGQYEETHEEYETKRTIQGNTWRSSNKDVNVRKHMDCKHFRGRYKETHEKQAQQRIIFGITWRVRTTLMIILGSSWRASSTYLIQCGRLEAPQCCLSPPHILLHGQTQHVHLAPLTAQGWRLQELR